MFDCGEGAQSGIMASGAGLMSISKIFISHWHADHFSGLLGLIQTLEMEGREEPLYIYGPPRTEEFTSKILETGYFHRSYDIIVEDLVEGDTVVGEDYTVKPFEVDHSINAFGYVLEESPKKKANREKMKELGLEASPKIGELKDGKTVSIDDEEIRPEIKHAEGADILLHEATCLHKIIEEREGHTSAKQAGEIAREAGVEKLLLTHVSRRYHGRISEVQEEAQEEFENSEVADDGEVFEIQPHRPE